MTTGKEITYILLLVVFGGLWYGIGYIDHNNIEYVHVPVIYNNTVERVEVRECELSCLDARNEGYLEGVAECEMHEMYVTAVNGKIRSYVDNTEGFYSTQGVLCVQTGGRSDQQIIYTFVHELMEMGKYDVEIDHFCN